MKAWVTEISRVRVSDKAEVERASEWVVGRIVGKRRVEKAAEREVDRVVWKRMAEKAAADAVVRVRDRQVCHDLFPMLSPIRSPHTHPMPGLLH